MNTQYPLQSVADNLASYGREGDSLLVHMNPVEVEGIAALAGGLTRNPVTGQLEAFNLWKTLVPIAASVGMNMIMPGSGALASGLGAGLGTTAVTGDLEKGLMAGITAGALGGAFGKAAEAGAGIAPDPVGVAAGIMPEASTGIGVAGTGIGIMPDALAANTALMPGMTQSVADMTLGERFAAATSDAGDLSGKLMKPSTLLPAVYGLSSLQTLALEDQQGPDVDAENEAARQAGYEDYNRAIRAAQPNLSGHTPYTGRRNTGFGGFKEGGYVKSMPHGGRTRFSNMRDFDGYGGYSGYSGPAGSSNPFGGSGGGDFGGFGGVDPIQVQANLRGVNNLSGQTPEGFMAGFHPEFKYFDNLPPGETSGVSMPTPSLQELTQQMYGSSPMNSFLVNMQPRNPSVPTPGGMADGGRVPLNTATGDFSVAPGGIANIPNEFVNPQQQAPQPQQQDIMMLAQALLSGVEGADQIVEGFIAQFGIETFKAVREMLLQAGTPNAQTEGLIAGQGGGMDDQVQGMIGDQQPVAVSPGEYIVPADVVSGLGDGSSDAGASELDQMMNNVRMARGGRMAQPPPINAPMMMPR